MRDAEQRREGSTGIHIFLYILYIYNKKQINLFFPLASLSMVELPPPEWRTAEDRA